MEDDMIRSNDGDGLPPELQGLPIDLAALFGARHPVDPNRERYRLAMRKIRVARLVEADRGRPVKPIDVAFDLEQSKASLEALVRLLINKGILTKAEYAVLQAEVAEEAAKEYMDEHLDGLGLKIESIDEPQYPEDPQDQQNAPEPDLSND